MTMRPVTVLKPLHGDEPLLEEALASVCQQDYPAWQVVFGVQDRSRHGAAGGAAAAGAVPRVRHRGSGRSDAAWSESARSAT